MQKNNDKEEKEAYIIIHLSDNCDLFLVGWSRVFLLVGLGVCFGLGGRFFKVLLGGPIAGFASESRIAFWACPNVQNECIYKDTFCFLDQESSSNKGITTRNKKRSSLVFQHKNQKHQSCSVLSVVREGHRLFSRASDFSSET